MNKIIPFPVKTYNPVVYYPPHLEHAMHKALEEVENASMRMGRKEGLCYGFLLCTVLNLIAGYFFN